MKRLFFLVVMLVSFGAFAQNMAQYSIIVKDIDTDLPIASATVEIVKTKQILLSNREGKVTFVLDGISKVIFSAENYETLTVPWEALGQNQYVIRLETKNNQLDEIVLTKEPPQNLLQKIVDNSKKRIAMPYSLKVYVREFFLLDDIYSYYNDGLVNFQFITNENKLYTDILVEQNRSYGLLEVDVSAYLKGYNLNDIMENYNDFKYFQPILEPKANKDYDFTIKVHQANKDYYIMSVTPLGKAKKALDNFEIIIDKVNRIIVEFTIISTSKDLDKQKYKTRIGAKNTTRSYIKVGYRLDDLDYYVLNSNEEIAYDLVLKDLVKNIQVRNSLVTTNFSKKLFTYKDSDVFKEKSLFKKKNIIITNYWDISGYTPTNEEKDIIQKLEYKL